MPRMTQAQKHANGLVAPTLPQHWLTVMLRVLVELVQSVVSTRQMNWPRPERDWHTRQTAKVLPKGTDDAQSKETQSVVASDIDCPMALMVGDTRSLRPSNHECVLIARRSEASGSGPLVRVLAKAGIQEAPRRLSRIPAAAWHNKSCRQSLLPALILSLSKDAGKTDARA